MNANLHRFFFIVITYFSLIILFIVLCIVFAWCSEMPLIRPHLNLIETLWQTCSSLKSPFNLKEWANISGSRCATIIETNPKSPGAEIVAKGWFYQILSWRMNTYASSKCLLFPLINLCPRIFLCIQMLAILCKSNEIKRNDFNSGPG